MRMVMGHEWGPRGSHPAVTPTSPRTRRIRKQAPTATSVRNPAATPIMRRMLIMLLLLT